MNTPIQEKRKKHWKYFIPLMLWMGVLFGLSSIPGESLPKVKWTWADKVEHVVAYGILGLLSAVAFYRYAAVRSKSLRWVYSVSVGLGLIYGALDEIHQLFVYGRSGEMLDFYADAAGIFFAHFIFYRTR